jgi:hypothetical protein
VLVLAGAYGISLWNGLSYWGWEALTPASVPSHERGGWLTYRSPGPAGALSHHLHNGHSTCVPLQVVRRADQRTYALKRVDLSELDSRGLANALNEIMVLASYNHPRIVGVYQTWIGEAWSGGRWQSDTFIKFAGRG